MIMMEEKSAKPKNGNRSPRAVARSITYQRAWAAAQKLKVSKEECTKLCQQAVADFDRLNPADADTFIAPPPIDGHSPSRIHWRDDEIKQVAINLAAKLREAGLRHVPDLGDKVGGSLVLDYLRIAQSEVLPRDRRRSGPTINRGNFKPEFWAAVEVALTAKTEPVAPLVELPPPPPVVEAPAPEPEAEKLAEVPLAKLLSHTLSALLEFVGKSEAQGQALAELGQWKEAILGEMSELHKEVGQLRVQIANGSHLLPEPPKKVLPRVAIVACQRFMFEHITRGAEARGIKCEWHHYGQDEKPKKVHAEWAISLRWGGHSWDDQLKISIPNPDRRVFLSGGTSEAIKQLEAWFALPS